MRTIVLGLLLAACSSTAPPPSPPPARSVRDNRLHELSVVWLERSEASTAALSPIEAQLKEARTSLGDMEAAGLGDKDDAKLLRATIARLDAEAAPLRKMRAQAWSVLKALHLARETIEDPDAVVRDALEKQPT